MFMLTISPSLKDLEISNLAMSFLATSTADLEETDVVVVEEGDQAVDEDAFEAEREHVDTLEDDQFSC